MMEDRTASTGSRPLREGSSTSPVGPGCRSATTVRAELPLSPLPASPQGGTARN